MAAVAVGVVLLGALGGGLVGVFTPAHVEIAGTEAQVQLHLGRAEDQAALSGDLLTAHRPTQRSVLGEPVGVSVALHLDPSTFVAPDGSFNADIVPVYVQAYSDPAQLSSDIVRAFVRHVVLWAVAGAVVALVALLITTFTRRSRQNRFRRLRPEERQHLARFFAAQRSLRRRGALAVAVVLLVMLAPSSVAHPDPQYESQPTALLAGTPFSDVRVGGLLRPALVAVRDYIETYFSDTNAYYDNLRDKVTEGLAADAVTLPEGPDFEHLVFVTDRHCNIGMDRVIVALAKHFGISILVSGGDDDFSGSFEFESACTKNLAEKSQRAGMTDVFVAGNHDSALTLETERRQHVKVLDGTPVTVDGLTFLGSPDPRTSRYGQGIRPSSAQAQEQVVTAQGVAVGHVACAAPVPVIAVLHGPIAGTTALQNGCGRAVLALDGHTHEQAGPVAIPLPDGTTGHQFIGGSTGGAPNGESSGQPFTSRLTVGPLNHDASINLVTVDRTTGRLVGVTVCHMTPEQVVTFEQLAAT
jgi:hypothetical protein